MFLINSDSSKFAKPAKSSPSPPTTSTDSTESIKTSLRTAKRSSSNSNDQVYERDRFKSRLNSFHLLNHSNSSQPPCDQLSKINTRSISLSSDIKAGLNSKSFNSIKSINMFNEKYLDNSVNISNPLDVNSSFMKNNDWYNTEFKIKYISQHQLTLVMSFYFKNILPSVEQMFPWLHGIHKENLSQRTFLCEKAKINIDPRKEVPVPKVRGLMLVRSTYIQDKLKNDLSVNECEGAFIMRNTGLLKNSVEPLEILNPLDISKQCLTSLVVRMFQNLKYDTSEIDVIINDCLKLNVLPIFKDLDPLRGVTLRNFDIQLSKTSHISDFIVYCFNEDHAKEDAKNCKCGSLSRILKLSQSNFQFRKLEIQAFCMDVNGSKRFESYYNTYVLQESSVGYFSGENSEFLSIKPLPTSFASKLPNSFFSKYDMELVNNWDHNYIFKERVEISRMSSATKVLNIWIGNTADYNVFKKLQKDGILESHFSNLSIHQSSTPHFVDPAKSLITLLNGSVCEDKLYFRPSANWKIFVCCSEIGELPELSTLNSYFQNSDLYSEIIINFPPSGSVTIGDLSESKLIAILNICKLLYYKSDVNGPALIHCSDGYTESTLISLCYLIYSKGIKLKDALIELHTVYNRPFYVFPNDFEFLNKFESILLRFSPKLNTNIEPKSLENLSSSELNKILYAPQKSYPMGWMRECQGSLPSRLLSHLYLGNLGHANSLDMLKDLGITKIISVGEHLDWITSRLNCNVNVINNCRTIKIMEKDHPIKEVMSITDLQDDGIDPLTESLNNALNFIDEAYNSGEKVLVHCRVGVSRSATVCVTEVMKRLNCTMAQAYLYVRVRRLNVIIQPNLRLMYELFKWQELVNLSKKKERVGSNLTDNTTLYSSSFESHSYNHTKSLPHISPGPTLATTATTAANVSAVSMSSLSKIEGIQEIDDVLRLHDNYLYSIESLNSNTSSISLESSHYNRNEDVWLRDVDWFVFCREVEMLNRAYVQQELHIAN